jgi:predicted nucleotidyltransferase
MRELDSLVKTMKLGYLVCGAVGRDIVLQHIYGIATGTATQDIDFGVTVESWDQFDRIKAGLISTGKFNASTRRAQRLDYRLPDESTYPLDIIPFGKVEDPRNSIAWPPNGDEVMNVIGYKEALADAIEVGIEKGFVVPVISLPGLALLKLFGWMDRGNEDPKDALDLLLLFRNYHEAGNEDRLYDEEIDLLEAAGFDLTTASPILLGKDVRRIAKPETLANALEIVSDANLANRLVTHMAPRILYTSDRIAEAERLLTKFKEGLQGAHT